METDKSSSILDWLESVPTDANSANFGQRTGSSLFPPDSLNFSPPVPRLSHTHAVLSTAQRKGWHNDEFIYAETQAMEACTNGGETPVLSRRAVSSNGIKIFETLRSMGFQNNPVLTTHLQLTAIAYKISRSKNFRTPPAYADSFGKNFPFSIVYSLSSSKDENNSTSRPEVSTRSTRFTCIFLIFSLHSAIVIGNGSM